MDGDRTIPTRAFRSRNTSRVVLLAVICVAAGAAALFDPEPLHGGTTSVETAALRARVDDSSSACLPADSSYAESERHYAGLLVSQVEDSESIAARSRWGLPVLDTSAVTVLADSTACRRALSLFVGRYPAYSDAKQVVLLGVAHRRLVSIVPSTLGRVGGHSATLVYDSTLTTLIDTWFD